MREILEAALLRELAATWREISGNHFRRPIAAAGVCLARCGGAPGILDRRSPHAFARALAGLSPAWGVVREVSSTRSRTSLSTR